MKNLRWLIWLFTVMIFASMFAFGCPKGEHEDSGACAYDTWVGADESKWVSNEKPPTDKMPSYERPGIKIVTAPPGIEAGTTTAHDYQAERNQQ